MAIKPINRELAAAINRGDGRAVLDALEAGADPNTSVGGQDMLYRAWKARRRQVFQVLVEHGARMQGRREGRETLYLARSGWIDLLAMAVERGWEMEHQTPEAISDARTVAGELVRRGDRDGLLMLQSMGQDTARGEIDRMRTPGRWKCTLAMAITENLNTGADKLGIVLDVLLGQAPREAVDCADVGHALGTWIACEGKLDMKSGWVLEQVRQSRWWTTTLVRSAALVLARRARRPDVVIDLASQIPGILEPEDMQPSLLIEALGGLRSPACNKPKAMLDLVQGLLGMGADANQRHQGMTPAQHLMLEYGTHRSIDFKALDALAGAGANLLARIEDPEGELAPGYRAPVSHHWHGCTMAHVMAWEIRERYQDDTHEGAAYLRQMIDRAPGLVEVADDQYQMTPLHCVVLPRRCTALLANKGKCVPVVEMLLDAGADPLARWGEGKNMLHAIASAWKQGLKPADGDGLLALLEERAPQLWSMKDDKGISGEQALADLHKKPSSPMRGP